MYYHLVTTVLQRIFPAYDYTFAVCQSTCVAVCQSTCETRARARHWHHWQHTQRLRYGYNHDLDLSVFNSTSAIILLVFTVAGLPVRASSSKDPFPSANRKIHFQTHECVRTKSAYTVFWSSFVSISDFTNFTKTFEQTHDKTNKITCAQRDSDQSWHPPSLIRVFAVRTKKAWVLSYSLSAQQRLLSDWRIPRLIWVFAGPTSILLILSCAGSFIIVRCSTQVTSAILQRSAR